MKLLPLKVKLSLVATMLLAACQTSGEYPPSSGHIGVPTPLPEQVAIPEIVERTPYLPAPAPVQKKQETYTVVVNDVPVEELLFALARDAKLNLDIFDNIEGQITLNAIDQTLPRILDRIGKQSNIRYRIVDEVLEISADTPYLHTYAVPYLNVARESRGAVSLSVELGASGAESGGQEGVARTNNSSASISNTSNNLFWEELENNLRGLLGETAESDSSPSDGGNASAETTAEGAEDNAQSSNVMVNSVAGLITVRANQVQHRQVAAYLETVLDSVHRQVLIEATIVEVNLSNSFSSGIDWTRVATRSGLRLDQSFSRANLDSASEQFNLSYIDNDGDKTMTSTIKLLEQFGNVKVLSSPKIMALNNQPSILKVVDNRVYFRLEVDSSETSGGTTSTTIETEINSVPVGFMMTVTPYVGKDDEVMLNIRPTISRILRFVNDPNPVLASNNVVSPVPEIQVREMETVLRLNSGQVAILGGLMQDTANSTTDQLPGAGAVPVAGELFKGREKSFSKSELVVFLRPLRIREPSLDGDLQEFKHYLPSPRPEAEFGGGEAARL
ncbi:MAG: pilus (MSHA type) biogenesis protein MshL [Gammaproteobacteria bacterium]|nr:MAG: pilus (MSHA type) biogenesis protein MshL [Gammaproteobacteria bacterium]